MRARVVPFPCRAQIEWPLPGVLAICSAVGLTTGFALAEQYEYAARLAAALGALTAGAALIAAVWAWERL